MVVLASSCTYPFNPDIPSLADRLVIEGDILIGSTTEVDVTYLMGLDEGNTPVRPEAEVSVEGSDGKVYKGTRRDDGVFEIDSRNFPTDCQYRMCIKNLDKNKTYHSSWLDVQTSPQIDSLSYLMDDDRKNVDITISLTAMETQKYYRWTFVEEWEYHSLYYASCYCIPGDMDARNPKDTVATLVNYTNGENCYYCWNKATSDGILLGTIEGLNQTKLVNHRFATINNKETKLNYIYRMTVTLQAIAQDGYDYWKNLDVISNYSGSLDSPNPSEMAGNITCDEDNEYVIGYINVSQVSVSRRYLYDSDLNFYDASDDMKLGEQEDITPNWFNTYYYSKWYRPVYFMESPGQSSYVWAYGRCVDCTFKGGSKEKKPADWPNNDK